MTVCLSVLKVRGKRYLGNCRNSLIWYALTPLIYSIVGDGEARTNHHTADVVSIAVPTCDIQSVPVLRS